MEQIGRLHLQRLNQSRKNNSRQRITSLIIFDWDDTLFCSSQLKDGVKSSEISALDDKIYKILSLAFSLGQVSIITNAKQGWVENCCTRFLPKVETLLPSLALVSARSKYETLFPEDSSAWKKMAFLELRQSAGKTVNIMAMGDQDAEMEAVQHLGSVHKRAYLKTVKFLPQPSLRILLNELEILHKIMRRLWALPSNEHLCFANDGISSCSTPRPAQGS